jgi:hypothetical protein
MYSSTPISRSRVAVEAVSERAGVGNGDGGLLVFILGGGAVDIGDFIGSRSNLTGLLRLLVNLVMIDVVFVGKRVGVQRSETARTIATTSQALVHSSGISSSVVNICSFLSAIVLTKKVVERRTSALRVGHRWARLALLLLVLLLLLQHDRVPIEQFFTLSSASLLVGIDAGLSTTTALEEAISILRSVKSWLTMGRFDAFTHGVQGDGYPAANIVGISSHFRRLENGNGGGDSDRDGNYGT